MKKKLGIIGLVFGIFVLVVVIRFFVFDLPSQTGRLKVLSSPNAGIFIDDVATGKTPYEARMKPGTYRIKLIPEGADSKTVAWEGEALVSENSLTYVARELGTSEVTSAGEVITLSKLKSKPKGEFGAVSVITEPQGAVVSLNTDEKGIAPTRLEDVPIGEHELTVALPGFFRRSQKIVVPKGYEVIVQIKLAVDSAHQTLDVVMKGATAEATLEADLKPTEEPAQKEGARIVILDTPTGFLNVREEPNTSAKQIDQVKPKEEYLFSESKSGWYKITLKDGTVGWISGDYVEEQ